MKNIIKACATCALILGASATTSYARGGHGSNDEAWAAIGGFIGGVIVSEALHDHDHHQVTYEYRYKDGHRDHKEGFSRRDWDRHHDHAHGNKHKCSCGGGYWKIVERRVLVPVKFGWQTNHCGQRVRYREPAHFEIVRERIWIGHHRPNCRFH